MLRDELAEVERLARTAGYVEAADWLAKTLRPRPRKATRLAPPPKVPTLLRPLREGDYFRNVRTGLPVLVTGPPEDGYVPTLGMQRRGWTQANRLNDSKLYYPDPQTATASDPDLNPALSPADDPTHPVNRDSA